MILLVISNGAWVGIGGVVSNSGGVVGEHCKQQWLVVSLCYTKN